MQHIPSLYYQSSHNNSLHDTYFPPRYNFEFTKSANPDCAKAEEGLKTTPNSECALNALAIDNPLEYARLYLDGTMQMWIDAEDSLELW